MRNLLLTFFLILTTLRSGAVDFKAGESLFIDSVLIGDTYLSGGQIHVNAGSSGDLVLAGGTISLNDSIEDDLMVAGGDISIACRVGDDIRAAGGQLSLNDTCGGHALITGGSVTVKRDAFIEDDLIVYGGNVILNGTVNGNIKVYGGNVRLNGIVKGNADVSGGELILNGPINGNARLKGDHIELQANAAISKNLEYWREAGTFPELENITQGKARYNPDMKDHSESAEDIAILTGIGSVLLIIVYLLSGLLLISLFVLLFPSSLRKATHKAQGGYMSSFGYGMLYFIATPFIIGLLFTILIGIPVGGFLLFVYVFSFLFAFSYSSVMLMYLLEEKTGKSWNRWKAIGIAFAISLILKLLLMIPFIGFLVIILIVATSFGGILKHLRTKALSK